MIEIKNRAGQVLVTVDGDSLKDANLSGANLSGADLTGRNPSMSIPEIKAGCLRCGVTREQIDHGYVIVSPRGTAHHGCDGDGNTDCGLDATGPKWWWPL